MTEFIIQVTQESTKKVCHHGKFSKYVFLGRYFFTKNSSGYHGRPFQAILHGSSGGPSDSMTLGSQTLCQSSHSSLVAPPQIESCHRGYLLHDDFGPVAKDYPRCVFRPTLISVMKGGSQSSRGTARGAQGRGRGSCGGGHRVTQSGRKCGQYYAIPS